MPRSQSKINKRVKEEREAAWSPDLPLPVDLHEAFAQECLRTNDLGHAYAAAHWRALGSPPPEGSNWGAAHHLRGKPNVDARVKHLRKEYLSHLKVSAESIAAELDEARELATMMRRPEAMINATMSKAKVYGIGEKGHQGGKAPGVMLVPTLGSAEDWERAATAQQAALKALASEKADD